MDECTMEKPCKWPLVPVQRLVRRGTNDEDRETTNNETFCDCGAEVGMLVMKMKDISAAIRDIGLALNATHNTVTTDIVGVEPNDTSWRVDHAKEIALLRKIEQYVSNIDTCPVCGCRNKCL